MKGLQKRLRGKVVETASLDSSLEKFYGNKELKKCGRSWRVMKGPRKVSSR